MTTYKIIFKQNTDNHGYSPSQHYLIIEAADENEAKELFWEDSSIFCGAVSTEIMSCNEVEIK